jgi:hypothetical protein
VKTENFKLQIGAVGAVGRLPLLLHLHPPSSSACTAAVSPEEDDDEDEAEEQKWRFALRRIPWGRRSQRKKFRRVS